MRASKTVRRLAKRVFELDTSGGGIVDVAPGNLLGGVGTERLPVVAIIALETRPEAVPGLVDDVARLQLLSAGFRPIFILTASDLAPIRHYGYVAELLIPEADWPHQHRRWQDYRDERLNTVMHRYRTLATVTAGPTSLHATSRTILGALAPVGAAHALTADASPIQE